MTSGDQENKDKDGGNNDKEIERKKNEVVIPTWDELTQAVSNDPKFEKMNFNEKNAVIKQMRAQKEVNKTRLEEHYPDMVKNDQGRMVPKETPKNPDPEKEVTVDLIQNKNGELDRLRLLSERQLLIEEQNEIDKKIEMKKLELAENEMA